MWPVRQAGVCFNGSSKGTVVIEFAILAPALVCLLTFIMEMGYDLFAQSALDSALARSVRQLEVGGAQGANTVAAFQTQYFCPNLSSLIPCSSVSLNIKTVTTDYYSAGNTSQVPLNSNGQLSTSGYSYCPGQPNSLMLAQALYAGPSIVGMFVPAMATPTASGPTHVTVSSIAFINENYPVTGTTPAGC